MKPSYFVRTYAFVASGVLAHLTRDGVWSVPEGDYADDSLEPYRFPTMESAQKALAQFKDDRPMAFLSAHSKPGEVYAQIVKYSFRNYGSEAAPNIITISEGVWPQRLTD